jgi:ATP-dependent protease ClpP protease subunit
MHQNKKALRKTDEDGLASPLQNADPFSEHIFNTYESLLEERIILINGDLTEGLMEKAAIPLMQMAQEKGPIQIYVNSFGGSINDSQAVCDIMQTIENPIITMAFGKAMSAAFDIFCCGDYRISYPNTVFMCHPPDDLIFCSDGLKEIKDMKIGDFVEHGINRSKVLAVRNRQHVGSIYEVKIEKLPPLRLTPEHPVLVRKGILKQTKTKTKHLLSDKEEFIPVKDIKPWDFVYFPKYKLEEPQVWKMDEISTHPNCNKVPLSYNITAEFAELLGWYLAEGSTQGEVGIQFTLSSKEVKEANRLCYLLSKFFNLSPFYNDRKDRHVIEIGVHSKILAYNFKKAFGKNAKEKVIPKFIMDSNIKIVKQFLYSYIHGDGSVKHLNKSGIDIGTASKKLSYQLIQLFSKLNILPSWRKQLRKDRQIKGSKFVAKGGILYHINIYGSDINRLYPRSMKNCITKHKVFETKDGFWVPIRDIKIIPYDGLVYNIETETHYYTGPVVVHNCHSGAASLGLQTLPALNVEAKLHEEYFSRWSKFYASRTKISEKEWFDLLNSGKNRYFFPQEAHQEGIVHHVVSLAKKPDLKKILKMAW